MIKIRLDMEDLKVESFATADGHGEKKGTVHAREFTVGFDCRTAQTGNAQCPGCQESGYASCVWCESNTLTNDQYCSWTDGDGAACYW